MNKKKKNYTLLREHRTAEGRVLPAGATIGLYKDQAIALSNRIVDPSSVSTQQSANELANLSRIEELEKELRTIKESLPNISTEVIYNAYANSVANLKGEKAIDYKDIGDEQIHWVAVLDAVKKGK